MLSQRFDCHPSRWFMFFYFAGPDLQRCVSLICTIEFNLVCDLFFSVMNLRQEESNFYVVGFWCYKMVFLFSGVKKDVSIDRQRRQKKGAIVILLEHC